MYCPQHPHVAKSKMVPVHRLIFESYLGRYLLSDEHIHHKNRIKTDNRIENLELLTINEHRRLHGLEDSPNRDQRKYHVFKNKIRDLRLNDKFATEISRILNIPRRTVQRYLTEMGLGGRAIQVYRAKRGRNGQYKNT